MRAGVIDIGSNSIKLIVGEGANGNIKVLEFLKNVLPIGRHSLFREQIPQEIINQAIRILEKYTLVLKEYEVTNVTVIATTAVREARNKNVFVDTVLRKTGLKVEILTVGDVSYYIDSYLSHKLKDTYPIHKKNLLIAELGGGSLDISVMEKGFTLMNLGLSLGTLRLNEFMTKLDGSSEETNEAVKEYIENEFRYLKSALPKIQVDDIILIDETYSLYLESILPGKKQVPEFYQFSEDDSRELLARLAERNVDEIADDYGIPSEIAETITGYAIILNNLFRLTSNRYVYILETPLAEAILASVIVDFEVSEKYNKTNQLISVASSLCQKYNVDLAHAQHVAQLCKTLFTSLRAHLGLKREDSLYLMLAAYLHDIGMFIHNRAHHKHTEYIISSLNLFRLTPEEIKVIACVARYHRKAPPAPSHPLYGSLPADRQILVQKLSAILRVANVLDRSHKQKVKKLEVELDQEQNVTIAVQVEGGFILEKAEFAGTKALFEEVTGSKVALVVRS